MKLYTRVLIALTLCLQLLYLPVNHAIRGGIAPVISLDAYIPIWPVWVVPYVLALAWWVGSIAWAAVLMADEKLFLCFMASMFLVISVGILTFVIYPTYVIRPQITGSDIFSHWLRLVYQRDDVYNALPSGHTYMTLVITHFFSHWKPRLRWLWISVGATIILSTLLTHQHFILDICAGILLSVGGIIAGSRIGEILYQRNLFSTGRRRLAPKR